MSFYLRPGSTSPQSNPSKAVLSGRLISNPTEEQLLAHGWTVYVQPEQVPQDPPLSLYQSLRTQYHAGFKSFRDYYLSVVSDLTKTGHSLPEPLTFRGLFDLLYSLGGEWVTRGVGMRALYDEVLFAVHGDFQQAYEILSELLSDSSL